MRLYLLQQILYNCISLEKFTKLHIVRHNHYAKFLHCWIHVNGAGKWKINITKLYKHPFWRLSKCVVSLFVVAANKAKVVKDVVNEIKYLFRALHSVTVETILNVNYFSSLFLVLLKIV